MDVQAACGEEIAEGVIERFKEGKSLVVRRCEEGTSARKGERRKRGQKRASGGDGRGISLWKRRWGIQSS